MAGDRSGSSPSAKRSTRWPFALALPAGLSLLASCGPPIRTVPLDVKAVHRELTGDVLSTGEPSTASRIVLQKRGLSERYADDPVGTLGALHVEAVAHPDDRSLIFALAELSFEHALHGGGRQYYLGSVLYAYLYLFGPHGDAHHDVFDPRGRLSADLYNVGLARAFESKDRGTIVLRAGHRRLPFGTLDVAFDPTELRWGDRRLTTFTSASELGVRGLRNRYRTWGLGAPLNAATEPLDPAAKTRDFIAPGVRVPVTLLLRPEPTPDWLSAGRVEARLDLYASTERRTVEIAGRDVPLEYEPTSALAEMLGGSKAWSLELAGLLSGDLVRQQLPDRLIGLEPFRPNRIPVVFVHGTASSSARWAEMVNDLSNDPELVQHYQVWAFSYDTGNPILYSAMLLREALQEAVAEFDPEHRNPCLQQMVVIGHSQGGLLTKLTVVDSGDRFWRNISDEPFADVDMSAENRALLERGIFVHPLPFVTEVVFIATPHLGSYRAGGFVRNLLRRLVSFPADISRAGADLLTQNEAGRVARQLSHLPTSVDNMAPGSPFVQALSELPIAPGVSVHSIIPVLGDGPLADGKDGVVAYPSAHLEGADSEFIVRGSGHSTQGDPRTIEEVHRILTEHAAAVFDGGACRTPEAARP